MFENGNSKTDQRVMKDTLEAAELNEISEEEWQNALSMTLEDVYANRFCMGESVSYAYFVQALVTALKLVRRVKEMYGPV
ncbi:MAG: hypothetical protein MJB12_08450 [Firmicutes bacterium]|nr:hypothetical protein [Bacillota bacterium]